MSSIFYLFVILTYRPSRSIMRTRAHTLGNTSPLRSRSPPSHHLNSVRSASSSNTSTQKHRQHPHLDHSRHHHTNTPKFDSTNLSRVSYGTGSGSSQALSRSLVGASGSLNGHCIERLPLFLDTPWQLDSSPPQSKSQVLSFRYATLVSFMNLRLFPPCLPYPCFFSSLRLVMCVLVFLLTPFLSWHISSSYYNFPIMSCI